jgi:sigma-E factor negative regulatory protein RseC
MIEERALILETTYRMADQTRPLAKVRVQRSSACDSCSLKSGCGQSALSKLSANHCLELNVDNTLGAAVGDEVLIAIPEQGLISASLRVYFLPLVFMLAAAVLADLLFSGDELYTLIFAFSGLLAGFAQARIFSQKHADHPNFFPKMVRIVRSSSTQNL